MIDQLPTQIIQDIKLALSIRPSRSYYSGDMERFFSVVGYLASNNNDSNKSLLLDLTAFVGTLYEIKDRNKKIIDIKRDHCLAKHKEFRFDDKWFQVSFLKKKHIPVFLELQKEITELTGQLDKQRSEILAMVEGQ